MTQADTYMIESGVQNTLLLVMRRFFILDFRPLDCLLLRPMACERMAC